MNLDIDGLLAFVRIHELGSFHEAASDLCISQPALSRRLKKLESMIGMRLLDRTTQKLSLTAIGREFYPQAQRLLQDLKAASDRLRDVSQWRSGSVTLAVIPTAAYHFLPNILRRYSETYPKNRIRIMDVSGQDVVQKVVRGDAEFGVGFLGKQDADIEFEPMLEDPYVLVCRRDHPLAQKQNVHWEHLKPYRLVHIGSSSSSGVLLDLALNQVNAQLKWFYEVDYQFSSGLGLVEAGLGVMVLPRMAFADQRYTELVSRPLTGPVLSRQIGIVRRAGGSLSPAAQSLYELLLQSRSHAFSKASKTGRNA